MQSLTAKQQQQIAALIDSASDKMIAKKLGVDSDTVQTFRRNQQMARRQKRERIFRMVMLALPVVVLALFEMILRLVNYGGNLALFVPKEEAPGLSRINDNVGRRYFASTEILPETSNDVFSVTKPANSFRIFFLGGSSTFGYPYAHNGSMSKMLGQRLADYFPDRKIEIVNLGMPAISSFSLLDMIDEVLAQRPDALVIYAGHNEFYGALGAGSTESLGRSRTLINFYLGLQRWKTVLLLRDGLAKFQGWFASAGESKDAGSTLMEQMVGDAAIAYGSEIYRRGLDFYKANLEKIIVRAKQNNVRVLLSEVVSNVRDQEPFVSLYAPQVDLAGFQKTLEAGRALESTGRYDQALALYDSLAAIDVRAAIVHFRLGKVYEQLGNFEASRTAYERARDFDGLRFRASEDINRVLHEVAQSYGTPIVAMTEAFEADSPHGLIGNSLMLEHLHPNLRGYFIMGREIAHAMKQHGFIAEKWDETRSRPDSVYWDERGVTPLDEEVAGIRIAVLKNSWPFVPKGSSRPFAYTPRSEFEKLAHTTWRRELTWEQAHVKLAEDFSRQRRFREAAAEYEALILETPYNVSPYVRAGLVYLAIGDEERAYQRFLQSIKIEPTAEACKYVGSILVQRNNPIHGIPYLERSLILNPSDMQARYNLTGAYLLVGNTAKVAAHLAELEKLAPNNQQVVELKKSLASLRAAKGESANL